MNEDELRTTLTKVAQRAPSAPDALDRIKTRRRRHERRRQASMAVSGVAAFVALAVVAVQLLPGTGTDPEGFASPKPTPGNVIRDDRARYIAWPDADGLQVYDVEGRRGIRIAATGSSSVVRLPHFAGDEVRWFESGATSEWVMRVAPIEQFFGPDPGRSSEPQSREVRTSGPILAAHPGPDGRVAVLTRETEEGEQTVQIWGQPDGGIKELADHTQTLWTFPSYLGRGISMDDAVTIEWSPDGQRILVVNTFVDAAEERQDETLIVLGVQDPTSEIRNGTHGVWLDNNRVAFKPYVAEDGDRWRVLDLTTLRESKLPVALPNAANPALSLDGKHLAIENTETNSILVLNLETKQTETVPGALPRWFDNDTLLVSEMEECSPNTGDGFCEPYTITGRAELIDLNDPGSPRRYFGADGSGSGHVEMSTLEAAILYADPFPRSGDGA